MSTLLSALASYRAQETGDNENPLRLPYYNMWTDQDGQSRLDVALMQAFGQKSMGGGAAPQWVRPFPGKVSAIQFAILPVGWEGDWHESPAPQWVIPLSGRWFIETSSGQRVEMGPGDLHFGQDQDTERGRGHRSGTIGQEPCVQIMIQFKENPAAQAPSPFA